MSIRIRISMWCHANKNLNDYLIQLLFSCLSALFMDEWQIFMAPEAFCGLFGFFKIPIDRDQPCVDSYHRSLFYVFVFTTCLFVTRDVPTLQGWGCGHKQLQPTRHKDTQEVRTIQNSAIKTLQGGRFFPGGDDVEFVVFSKMWNDIGDKNSPAITLSDV
jgi:hypothetical protein